MRIARALLLSLVVLLGPQPRAGAEGEVQISIVDIDDTAFPRMEAVITADVDGRPLTELEAGALRVFEGADGQRFEGRVLSVTPAVDAGTSLALILAIDASGSMAGAPIIEAGTAAASMVESLAPTDSAAIVSFADEVQVLQGITDDRAALLDALGQLNALGNTTLYDGIAQAAEQASASGYSRRAVVLLSDGEDFGGLSALTADAALEAVDGARTIFYVVGYGEEIDRPFLEAVADRSGGRFFPASDTQDIATIYSSLEELLRSQLVVTFESAAPEGAGARGIEVRVTLEDDTGVATRTYDSSRPARTPAPAPPAIATAAAPRPAVEPESEGSSRLPLVLGALIAVGLVTAGALRLRRRPADVAAAPVTPLDARPLPRDVGPLPSMQEARLDVVAGPSHVGPVPLGSVPVTVGSGPACALRLPPAAGVAAEHARIWSRDGRPMLHHLADDHETLVNGARTEWASLREQDEVHIGPYVIRYRAVARETAATAATGGPQ